MEWKGSVGSKEEPYPPGTGGRRAEIAVDVEEFFGASVVRLHIGIGDGPRGRDAAFVPNDTEVFGPHAEHSSTVNLGLSPDEIGLLRVQWVAFLILPGLLGVVAVVEKDGGGIPVKFLLRHERTALKDEDFLASLGEVQSESSAASSGADDDRVVLHDSKMQIGTFSPQDPQSSVSSPALARTSRIKEAVWVVAIGMSGSHG